MGVAVSGVGLEMEELVALMLETMNFLSEVTAL